MKKHLLISTIALLLTTTTLLGTETVTTDNVQNTAKQTSAVQAKETNNNFYNMGRGVVNLTTCWLEVFRCMVYRNSEVPFWGFIAGAVEGSGLTGMRAFGGVTDVMFLGFDIGSIYNDQFQDFVWNSKWVPKASLQDARKAAGQ
jgi:hypothetical protein